MDEIKDNGIGVAVGNAIHSQHIRIGDEEIKLSMKTNPFVTEVVSVVPDAMTYVSIFEWSEIQRCELNGVLQSVSNGDNREGRV